MKPVILIQTDFSLSWSAVAQMKGVMKQVDPELEIVDQCHDIKTFDPWEASLSLQATEPYWPKGTIFVSVVDPGVGTARRTCAARLKDGMIIITPDNGSLTHVAKYHGIQTVREIDETINRLHGQGTDETSVFHGRDLFGYCAARLASNIIPLKRSDRLMIHPKSFSCQSSSRSMGQRLPAASLKSTIQTSAICLRI